MLEKTASASGRGPARSCGSPCPRRSGRCAARSPRRKRAGACAGCGAALAQPGSAAPPSSSDEPSSSWRRSRSINGPALRYGCRADDQLRRMQFLGAAVVAAFEDREQPLERALAKLGDPHPNGRQPEMARQRNVVEAGDRDVLGHAQARPRAAPAARRSPYVVGREDGVERGARARAAPRSRRSPDSSSKSPWTISQSQPHASAPACVKAAARSSRVDIADRPGDMDEPLAADARQDARRPPARRPHCRGGSRACRRPSARVLIEDRRKSRRKRRGEFLVLEGAAP